MRQIVVRSKEEDLISTQPDDILLKISEFGLHTIDISSLSKVSKRFSFFKK